MTRILFIIAAVVALAGCNTIAGMGQDIKAGGDKVEKSAEKNKGY